MIVEAETPSITAISLLQVWEKKYEIGMGVYRMSKQSFSLSDPRFFFFFDPRNLFPFLSFFFISIFIVWSSVAKKRRCWWLANVP